MPTRDDIYRARDTKLGRDVAIKVLPPHFSVDAERRSRFRREANLLATLNHPHIGTIHGFEETDDGIGAIVMELVEGPTLAQRLDRGPLPLAEALTVARQIADALEAAHEKGIVHRDLKPDNVVLQTSTSGEVRAKVIDFGLAKTVTPRGDERAPHRSSPTEDGRILGTPAYMSPEQARGLPVDKRTDIWAFGCVLFEMLTGRRAFEGATASDTIAHVLEHEPDWSALPARTPPTLRALLERCLRKDAGRRLQHIVDARIELDIANATASPGQSPPYWRRVAPIAVSTALALLGAMLAWTYWPAAPGASQPASPSHTRLTFASGLQTDPTFSPLGDLVAYASNQSGNYDIWVQPASAEGLPHNITDHPSHDTQPDWSPTNSTIVFRSERDGGGLFTVGVTGGSPERLVPFGYKPRWAPDGARVLFVESDVFNASRGRVYTVALDRTPPQALDMSKLPQQLALEAAIGWHPDSQRVTFLRAPPGGGQFRVSLLDVESGTAQPLKVRPSVELGFREQSLNSVRTEPVAWAANRTVLYFVGFSKGLYNIWSVDVDPRTHEITGGPRRITTMPEYNERITLARNGTRIAFGAADRNYRILSYPLDPAGTRIAGKATPLTPPALFSAFPDLTKDGSRLVFKSFRPGSGTGRLDLQLAGEGLAPTGPADDTFGKQDSRSPFRWSPDGTMIAYRYNRQEVESASARVTSLMLLDPTTGKERPLTTKAPLATYGQEIAYGWTPDSRYVVTTRNIPGEHAIALVPVSGAPSAEKLAEIIVRTTDDALWNADISPNGRWVLFQAQKETPVTSRLGIADRATGRIHWVTDGGVWVDKPRWSVDGRLIYFISRQGGLFNVWAIGFDPDRGVPIGQPFQLTHFDRSGEQIPLDAGRVELAVARDRLAMPIINPVGAIWMLDKKE
jgi:serine/threonine protein kinase